MNALWKEFRLSVAKHSGKYIEWQALEGWTNFGKDKLNWSYNKEHPTAWCYGTLFRQTYLEQRKVRAVHTFRYAI